jgi:phosphoribosylformimino-5-aminoimidazole carboxamide ribotide isomerase
MRIIPAIDVIDGKCVRLTQGDYAQKKIYNENPLDVAKEFESAGLKYLHLVDLDGAKAGRVVNWDVVKTITSMTKLNIDFGGGIKTADEVQRLFDLGIQQVNLGSIAVKEPETVKKWISKYGGSKIILSADVQNEKIAINGWTENAGIGIIEFISDYQVSGMTHITCTDIATDGTLGGPNIHLYRKLVKQFPALSIVASGGVGDISHLHSLVESGVSGVIIGKAIYEGKITLNELKMFSNESC